MTIMSLFRTLKRCTETAIKLPVAATWDLISLGNMGDTASITKVLREHQQKKQIDDLLDIVDVIKEIQK